MSHVTLDELANQIFFLKKKELAQTRICKRGGPTNKQQLEPKGHAPKRLREAPEALKLDMPHATRGKACRVKGKQIK